MERAKGKILLGKCMKERKNEDIKEEEQRGEEEDDNDSDDDKIKGECS